MSDKLALEDFIHSVPDTVGEQVAIHHCKSGKGNDKLFIKRIDNGAIAYCHHCGQRGYASLRALGHGPYKARSSVSYASRSSKHASTSYIFGRDRSSESSTGEDSSTACRYPSDARNQVKHWSSNEAKIWILKYGLSMDTINTAGICWSDKFSSILFPRFYNGDMVAFQARKFPYDGGPKYMTYGDSNSLYDPLKGSTGGSTLVLVEDYLSGLKVSQIAPAFVLNGTGLKDAQLSRLLQDYSKFVIMLDNDNWQVKTAQMKLHKRISTYAKACSVVELERDPKEYGLADLQIILQDYI